MLDSPLEILQLVASGVIGYLLGSLPFAQLVSRRRQGVDIFSTGTSLAGTANVFWNVGRGSGLLVFAGDVGKGTAAVAVAWALGVDAPLTLVPVLTVLAAVVGVSTVLLLRSRLRRSAWGICTGYLLMLGLGLAFDLEPLTSADVEIQLVAGLTVFAGLVLIRSAIVRRRHGAADAD